MEYLTRFKIEILEPVSGQEWDYKPYPSPIFVKDVIDNLYHISGYTFTYEEDDGYIYHYEPIMWYDNIQQIKQLTDIFPGVLFIITGIGSA